MIKAAAVARENIRKCVVGTLADMNATQVGVALRRLLEGDTSTALYMRLILYSMCI